MNHPLDSLLTSVSAGITHDPAIAMLSLFNGLADFRANLPEQSWKEYVAHARKSPLCQILHADPFTYRSFSKPRGYPGDAALLDMIYYKEPPQGISSLAAQIFSWTITSPASEAVRQRRQILAEMLDEHCGAFENPSILSVASGHLREVDISRAVSERQFKRYVAFDQDCESLSEVDNKYGSLGVTCIAGAVRDILTRKVDLSGFNFVYTLGLFDYFSERLAIKMTADLFNFVCPGGKLLIANFLPSIRDVGYMECFMDWWLIYRTHDEMDRLLNDVPKETISSSRIFYDPTGQIVFLEVVRR